MKMKKLVSLLMVAALSASMLTGCGSSNDAAGSSDAATDATAEGTENAAGGTLKIGSIGPLTGSAAVYGTAVANAAQLAVDEVNAAGGVNGMQLELNFQDDECDAEKSVNAYNTLKDWGMQMLVGAVTSGCSIAVSEYSKDDNMFQLTPSGSAVECVQYDNAFRMCFSDPNQGSASADYIAENKLATKVAIIYNSSDTYSSGIYQTFATEAKAKGLDVVAAEAFTADNKTDFSVQLQKAKDAGADLLFLPIYYQEASIILKQADTMGYKPKFFGVDGMDGILTVENFDTKLAEDVMLLTPFAADAKDKTVQNFVKTYKEKYKDTPNQFAADSYDAVYALKAAIEESKATTDMSASDMCDALKGAMTKIKMQGLTGGKDGLTWNESGEVTKSPKAVIIKNGAYKAM